MTKLCGISGMPWNHLFKDHNKVFDEIEREYNEKDNCNITSRIWNNV
jgi:hypothetical protein